MAETVIAVENLVTHYGPRMILKGITLSVRAGEIMVVMGGSGSGKTTLLRHLLALERPTSGTVRLLGLDPWQMSERALHDLRRQMGVAFQGGALFSSLTVGENIILPLAENTRLDRTTMEIMARLKLEVVNLSGCEHLLPDALSGGMLKRAALARAIVMDPRLLFCDEPSAGLDPVVASAIDDLILKLRQAMGMTILVVTHELASAFKIADRVTVLDQGELLFIGTPEELRQSRHPRIRNLLHRQAEGVTLDPGAYLDRLTGE